MTYREKLAKERPNCVVSRQWGGCMGCPGTYGYSNDKYPDCPYGRASKENCAECWGREIPGESTEPEEFAPGTSYVEFVDGHREAVTFYERTAADGSIFFATCSGVYLFKSGIETITWDRPWSPHMKVTYDQFYRVNYAPGYSQPAMIAIESIRFIAIDTRIKHDYSVTLKDGRTATGSIWVERDMSVEKIREAVMNDVVTAIVTEATDA